MKYIFILVCLLSSSVYAQQSISPSALAKIDALFEQYENLDSPGYAIGISRDTQTLLQKGYGAANLDYNIPIEPNSAFSIASVSKQFTAACIALLILEDKVSLETPASEFIPELKKYDAVIKVKHLIYNTSGLIDYYRLPRESGKSWITFNYFGIDESLKTSLSQDTLLFTPGEQWNYSNVNFMLLAKIVEKVSGQSFSDFAKERLFKPLGMDNTIIHNDITAVIKNRVMPYNLRNAEAVNNYRSAGIYVSDEGDYIQHHRNSPHYGGSGVVTTIEDILKWSKNFTSGAFGGKEFYDLMHQTMSFNHGRDNQAFGLYHGDFNGRKIVAWDGGDFGISSQLMRFPDQGIAIVVLSNLGSGESFRKANQIADILIEEGIMK